MLGKLVRDRRTVASSITTNEKRVDQIVENEKIQNVIFKLSSKQKQRTQKESTASLILKDQTQCKTEMLKTAYQKAARTLKATKHKVTNKKKYKQQWSPLHRNNQLESGKIIQYRDKMDKFSKMRHIFSKMLQIMVLLKNDHLAEENEKTEYCHCAVFFKERLNFKTLAFSCNNSKQ